MTDQHGSYYEAHIHGGLQFTGIHDRVEDWIKEIPGSHFDKLHGVSWINGRTFYHNVVFLSEQDLVAFKLKFAGFISTS